MATQPYESGKPSEAGKLRSVATPASELAVIAQRAQAFTNASGAAIALGEGDSEEIVCRARSGPAAPEVGTQLRVEGSFTGLCIQSGKELRCDDTETDTRIDTAAIRSLGIRSMVVTPIKDEGKVAGVLAVFAPTPHAFTITHVAVLKTMADQVATILQRERKPKGEAGEPELVAAAVTAPKPVASVPLTAVPAPSAFKPASAPAIAVRVPSPKSEAVKTALPVEISKPVVAPRVVEERRIEFRPEPTPRASFNTLDAAAAKSSNKKFVVMGLVVVVLVGGGIVALLKMRQPGKSATPQSTFVSAPVSASADSAPAATATATSKPETLPVASTTADQPAATTQFPDNSPRTKSSASDVADSGKKVAKVTVKETAKRASPADDEQPVSVTVPVSTGGSKIAVQKPQSSQGDDVQPNLSLGGGTNAGGLSMLASSPSTPAPKALAHSELIPAASIRQIAPVYPAIAMARRLSGAVVVKFTVGKDGRVYSPKFVSGQPVFRDAAFDAVKQWTYKPAMLDGQPAEQEIEVRLNFKP